MKELALVPIFVFSGTQTDGNLSQGIIEVQEIQLNKSTTNILSYTVNNNEYIQQENIYDMHVFNENQVNKLNALLFTEVYEDGIDIKLRKPFMICYRKYGEYYIAENEGVNIYCWGRSIDEMKEDINENLYVLYKCYVDCDTSELTRDAINLRSKLKELFA